MTVKTSTALNSKLEQADITALVAALATVGIVVPANAPFALNINVQAAGSGVLLGNIPTAS